MYVYKIADFFLSLERQRLNIHWFTVCIADDESDLFISEYSDGNVLYNNKTKIDQ